MRREHLGIFIEPYLTEILDQIKTIDLRISKNKIAPYHKINSGDHILIKKSGGNICGEAYVKKVKFFENLTPNKILEFTTQYQKEIRAKTEFIQSKLDCKYATLIWFEEVKRISNYPIKNHGRSGWVILFEEDINQRKLFKLNIKKK